MTIMKFKKNSLKKRNKTKQESKTATGNALKMIKRVPKNQQAIDRALNLTNGLK